LVQGDGENDWYMRGVKQGKDVICIEPIIQNFLFPQQLEASYGSLYANKPCAFQAKDKLQVAKSRGRGAGESAPQIVSYSDDMSVGPAPGKVSLHDFAIAAYAEDGSLDRLLSERLQESRQEVTQ